MGEDKCCDTCGWCYCNELGDLICVNGDGEYTADFVERKHTCDDWESK